MNDCLYRAHVVDNIKYMALVDLDEILMVFHENSNLLDFLVDNDKKNYNSFLFRNVFFFRTNKQNYTTVPKNSSKCLLYSNFHPCDKYSFFFSQQIPIFPNCGTKTEGVASDKSPIKIRSQSEEGSGHGQSFRKKSCEWIRGVCG